MRNTDRFTWFGQNMLLERNVVIMTKYSSITSTHTGKSRFLSIWWVLITMIPRAKILPVTIKTALCLMLTMMIMVLSHY